MLDIATQLTRSNDLHAKVVRVFQHRAQHAQEQYIERLQKVVTDAVSQPMLPWDVATSWYRYTTDFWQRSVLFWDTLRRRGNQFVEREQAGKPPVLHFEYEMVLDARQFERPVNYALVRIVPPAGVTVDPKRRPYVIIDPRAGHGPGIGGFKDDSQVGVALHAGHPVYFVIFFPEPEPEQTMLDVCSAEQRFVRRVRELHPDSPKPVIVGNCQGGWAAMMLAASTPEDSGPLVINGAPMSYWGGAWSEGEGNNPMRYAGGLLGGTWLASFAADLGNGVFDGAHLVQNFESLNPANTLWGKNYHVFANADTEPPRFLDFERWWGGFYLMNRAEIEWITQNLFVSNKLWTGGVKGSAGDVLDLREVRSPIIVFASMGDNITPPQQAFNWVADVYRTTEEIKARGQTIVGLLHQSIGHLGIFVSGKVAKKEHAQIVSVLKSIEALPPGLYGMEITERKRDGAADYEVTFVERRLEDVVEHLNRFKRVDEKPFAAVAAISEFNQRAYELFAQPVVRATANAVTAQLGRQFHPLRFERWSISDLNPWLWWLGPATDAVKANRQATDAANPLRKSEKAFAEMVSATLDYYRDVRDAMSEAAFFETYGNLFSIYLADKMAAETPTTSSADPRTLPFVTAALDAMEAGGYPAALARMAELLERHGAPVPLARIERKAALVKEYADLLPDLPIHEWKLVRGQQDVIVRFEPERAFATLPRLLADPADRERFLMVLDRIANDRQLVPDPTREQVDMLKRIRGALGAERGQQRTAARRATA